MRKALAAVGIAGVVLLSAGPAFADRGAPGSTFPENGNTHSNGCAAVFGAPSASFGSESNTARFITTGLFTDACLGGP